MMQCGELVQALEMMKTHVQRVAPEARLCEAVDLMDLYQVRSLPVVDSSGVLVGVLSEKDVALAMLQENGAIEVGSFEDWAKVGGRLVRECMTSPAIAIFEAEDVGKAILLMFQNDLNRIPVLTTQNRVIGVLNRVDVLQALFEGRQK